jgi:hypothetical protein
VPANPPSPAPDERADLTEAVAALTHTAYMEGYRDGRSDVGPFKEHSLTEQAHLLDRLRRGEEDTARLDWLGEQSSFGRNHSGGKLWVLPDESTQCGEWRDVIDAARLAATLTVAEIQRQITEGVLLVTVGGVTYHVMWDEDVSVIGAWPDGCDDMASATRVFGTGEAEAAPAIFDWIHASPTPSEATRDGR